MLINAATIYKKKDKRNPSSYSHILVLSTTRGGCTFVYIANEIADKCYKNIDGIKFEGIGYVGFDRPLYVSWAKTEHNTWRYVTSVSYRKYSAITTAIKQFMDGDIVQTSDGVFYYSDEVPEENNDEPIAEPQVTNVQSPVEISISINNTNTAVEEITSTVMTKIKNPITDEIRDGVNVYGIPVDVEKKTVLDGVKYVNLLESDSDSKYHHVYTESSPGKSSKKAHKSTRAMYTEDEALGIACMSLNQICSSYKVNYCTASLMRKNARKYHDIFDAKDSKNQSHGLTGLAKMIDDGATLEDCLNAYPAKYSARIKNTYEYKKNNANNRDIDELNKFIDNLVSIGDYDTIIRLENLSAEKLVNELCCSHHTASSIGVKMRDILFKNIYYAAGMKNAYSANFDVYIESAKESDNLEARSVIARYDICNALKDIYEKTYSNHHNILIGIDPVPQEAMVYKEQYLSLIHNRFNKQSLIKGRALNNAKRAALETGSTFDVSVIFMIDTVKSRNVLIGFKRNNN